MAVHAFGVVTNLLRGYFGWLAYITFCAIIATCFSKDLQFREQLADTGSHLTAANRNQGDETPGTTARLKKAGQTGIVKRGTRHLLEVNRS